MYHSFKTCDLGPDELNFPVRLAIDSHEYVYVADEDNHRIKVGLF